MRTRALRHRGEPKKWESEGGQRWGWLELEVDGRLIKRESRDEKWMAGRRFLSPAAVGD